MRLQGLVRRAGVVVIMLGLALLASTPASKAQCPFENPTGSLSFIDIHHNGASLPRSGQLFLPGAPAELSLSQAAAGTPHFALPAMLIHPSRFALLNTTTGDIISAAAFNTCTSSKDNMQYLQIPGDSIMLRTPPAATPQAFDVTYLAYAVDGQVLATQKESVVYECGCPTPDCTACERCVTAACPVAQQLANQTCEGTNIPDSVCEPTAERAAMLGLRQSSPQLTALWSVDDHHCDWEGVTCDGTQSVTGVDVSGTASTTLTVPPSFSALQNLASLNLAGSGLSTFPIAVQQLPNLNELLLQHNSIGPGPVPDAVWSLPVSTLNLANNSLHGNLTTTGTSPTLPATLTMADLSDNMFMGPPPLAANNAHALQLTLRQREGFFFDCTNNAMLDLGDSVRLDIDPANCTVCGAAYALANSNAAASAVAAGSLPPAPALMPGGEVMFTCDSGYRTSEAVATFSLVCQQAPDNNTFYECPAADGSECQCIEEVEVDLLRDVVITGITAATFTNNANAFLAAVAAAVGVSRNSVDLLVPARDAPGNGTEAVVVALAVTTRTVSGFDTPPLTGVRSALDMLGSNATFIASVKGAAAAFASVGAITVSEYTPTASTTAAAANSTASLSTTQAPSNDSSGAPVAAIAGAAGGAGFLLVLVVVVCLCRRRGRNKTGDKSENSGSGGLQTPVTTATSTPLDGTHSRQVVNPVFDDGLQASTNDYDLDARDSGDESKGEKRKSLNSKRRMVLGNTMGASSDAGAHVLQFDGDAGAEAETDDAAQKHSKLRPESVMEKVAGFAGFDIGETDDGAMFDLDDGETFNLDDGETFNLDDGGFGTHNDVDVDEFEEDTDATAGGAAAAATSTAAKEPQEADGADSGKAASGALANSPFFSGGFPESTSDDVSEPGEAAATEGEKQGEPAGAVEEKAQGVTEHDAQGTAVRDEEAPALPHKSGGDGDGSETKQEDPSQQQQAQPSQHLPKEEEEEEQEEEEEEAPPPPPAKSAKSAAPPEPAPVQTPTAPAAAPPPLPVKTTPAKAPASAGATESPYSSLPPRSKKASVSSPAQTRRESRGSIGSAAGLSRTTSGSSASRMSVKRSEEARRAAREARINALKAAKEQEERQRQHKHPSQWSFNECVAWLRHHGFKEFVDVFYNNGFEGRQLVALQARSFSGVRSLSQDRILALVDAIAQLKAVGYWEPPEIEDEDVDTLAPLEEEEETSGPPLASTANTSSPGAPAPPPTSTLPASLASTAPPPPPMSSRPLPPRPPASLGAPPAPPASTTASTVPSTLGAPPPVPGTGAIDTSDAMEKARIEHILSQHLTRDDARALLKHGQGDEGEYLFRASQSSPGAVVLSMCHEGQLHHFQIQREGPLYVTPNKLTFPSLIELVKYFRLHDNVGLPCRLSHACTHYDNVIPKPADTGQFGFGDDVLYDDLQAPPVPAEDEYEVLEATQTQKAQFEAMRAFTQN